MEIQKTNIRKHVLFIDTSTIHLTDIARKRSEIALKSLFIPRISQIRLLSISLPTYMLRQTFDIVLQNALDTNVAISTDEHDNTMTKKILARIFTNFNINNVRFKQKVRCNPTEEHAEFPRFVQDVMVASIQCNLATLVTSKYCFALILDIDGVEVLNTVFWNYDGGSNGGKANMYMATSPGMYGDTALLHTHATTTAQTITYDAANNQNVSNRSDVQQSGKMEEVLDVPAGAVIGVKLVTKSLEDTASDFTLFPTWTTADTDNVWAEHPLVDVSIVFEKIEYTHLTETDLSYTNRPNPITKSIPGASLSLTFLDLYGTPSNLFFSKQSRVSLCLEVEEVV